MNSKLVRVSVFVLVALCRSPATGAERIGQFADLEYMVIEGAETFTPEKLKAGLRADAPFLLADHPTTTKAEFFRIVRNRLQQGYLRKGFANVEIRAHIDYDAQRLVVHIDEGPQLIALNPEITGVPDDIIRHIRRRLVEYPALPSKGLFDFDGFLEQLQEKADADDKETRSQEPCWRIGEPVPLNKSSQKACRNRVRDALEELGYRYADFTTNLKKDETGATLQVHIRELRPPMRITRIEINGNTKNSDKAILEYLKIHTGQRYTDRLERDIHHALWKSARFCEQNVTTKKQWGEVFLTIDVQEHPAAPRLTDEFSREEAAMLKCHEWLSSGAGHDCDLVCEENKEDDFLRVIVSPAGELVIELGQANAKSEDRVPTRGLSVNQQGARCYLFDEQLQLGWPASRRQIYTQIGMTFFDDPTTDRQHKFTFCVGVYSDDRETIAPVRLTGSLSPVFFVDLAHYKVTKYQWEGNLLTVLGEHFCCKVDAATGRFIEYVQFASAATADGKRTPRHRFTFRRGVLEQSQAALKERAQGLEERFDPTHPITSSLEFFTTPKLLDNYLRKTGKDGGIDVEKWRLASKLLRAGLLDPLESLLLELLGKDEQRFTIPSSRDAWVWPRTQNGAIAFFLFAASDRLFSYGNGPWKVWRETCCMYGQESTSWRDATKRIMQSDDVGPVGCWCVAKSIRKNCHYRRQLAALGLARCSREKFITEIEDLVTDDGMVGECLRRAIGAMDTLTPHEIELIESTLKCEGVLASIVSEMKRHSNPNSLDALRAVAGQIWDSWVQERLVAQLSALSSSSPSRPRDPARTSGFPIPKQNR